MISQQHEAQLATAPQIMFLRRILDFIRKLVPGKMNIDPPALTSHNSHIFPPPQVPFTLETSTSILEKILSNRDAIDHVGNMYVSAARYCKMTNFSEHEFIVLDVRDKLDDSARSTVLVHRVPEPDGEPEVTSRTDENPEVEIAVIGNNSEETPVSNKSSGSRFSGLVSNLDSSTSEHSRQLFSSSPAADQVVCSRDINLVYSALHLHPYNEIETLTISHDSLTIEKVLVLARTLSIHGPWYNVRNTQCYWYASIIWDVLIQLARAPGEDKAVYWRPPNSPRRIKKVLRFIALRPGVHEQDALDVLRPKYDTNWSHFCSTVEERHGQGYASMTAKLNAERAQKEAVIAQLDELKKTIGQGGQSALGDELSR